MNILYTKKIKKIGMAMSFISLMSFTQFATAVELTDSELDTVNAGVGMTSNFVTINQGFIPGDNFAGIDKFFLPGDQFVGITSNFVGLKGNF